MSVEVSTSGGVFQAGLPKLIFDAPRTDRPFDATPDGRSSCWLFRSRIPGCLSPSRWRSIGAQLKRL